MSVDSDIDAILEVPCDNKARTGVFKACKHNKKNKTSDDVVIHRYCMIYKKSLIPENYYMSNSAETCFGNISD